MDVMIGEIKAFAFNWAPYGWYACNGMEYPVINNQALYAVIGNTYGGTPGQTFKVPNLQGRIIVGAGQLQPPAGTGLYNITAVGGTESVQISSATVPPHTHAFNAATTTPAKFQAAETKVPSNGNSFLSNVFERVSATTNRIAQAYSSAAPDSQLSQSVIGPFTGGTSAHENRQPYLVVNYCINWDGDFPPRP